MGGKKISLEKALTFQKGGHCISGEGNWDQSQENYTGGGGGGEGETHFATCQILTKRKPFVWFLNWKQQRLCLRYCESELEGNWLYKCQQIFLCVLKTVTPPSDAYVPQLMLVLYILRHCFCFELFWWNFRCINKSVFIIASNAIVMYPPLRETRAGSSVGLLWKSNTAALASQGWGMGVYSNPGGEVEAGVCCS